jgi:hypothetical protein
MAFTKLSAPLTSGGQEAPSKLKVDTYLEILWDEIDE